MQHEVVSHLIPNGGNGKHKRGDGSGYHRLNARLRGQHGYALLSAMR